MTPKKLFLLDAYALIYRAYYALIRAPRVTSDGRNTSAIFGFCNTLDDILRKENPQFMAVCFDPRGDTFRHEAYAEYKAGRDKQPEDITMSVPYIKQIVEAYGIKVVEVPGYEADDVIGTLASVGEAHGFDTYMMTPDKDYGQLVSDHVFMYRPALKGQGFEVRGPQEVCERYGINTPSQVIDLLALEGDASDNIPGCPGVGEKTAAKLIQQFGSVENMLANTDKIKGALRKKVEDNAEQIKFSKFLATICREVPLDFGPEALERATPDTATLRTLFRELEFRSLMSRIDAMEPAVPAAPQKQAAPVAADGMGSLFDAPADDAPAATSVSVDYVTVTDPTQLQPLAQIAARTRSLTVYVNADGEEAMTAVLRGVALVAGDAAAYIPYSAATWKELSAPLAGLIADAKITVASHDVKRDMIILRRHGLEWTAPYYDTAIAHYLLKPEGKHDLADVAMQVASIQLHDYALSATARKKPLSPDPVESGRLAMTRVVAVQRLVPLLQKQIAADGTEALLNDIELPLVPVLANMEWEGVRIDTAELARMSAELTERMQQLEREAWQLAGCEFNIGSPSQVGEVLFGRLQIDPKAKRTKTGAWSTTEEILEKHRRQWPVVDIILQVRGLRKLLATYIDALPRLINPRTGKIHTTYNQTVTATGRISSTNPNLQNIPIRTDLGREIRRAFIGDPDCLIMSADYSQIELRLMACLSGDPTMVHAFNSGEDIHRSTAAKIYKVPLEEVSDTQRRNAKTANFGIIYGISAFGLSERLGIPRAEAKHLIDGYLTTYPGVAAYIGSAVDRAREDGYVSTVQGRKRYLPEINSRNAVVRGYAERNAVNAPLQGSAADIIKIAMIDVDREIRTRGLRSRMIMQVHDELVFNVHPAELAVMQEIVPQCMERAFSGAVPLTVSAGVAPNWLEAH